MISNDRHQNVRILKETSTEKTYLVTDESSPKGETDVLTEITAPSIASASSAETFFQKQIQPLLNLRHPQLQQLKQFARTDRFLSITQAYIAGKTYQAACLTHLIESLSGSTSNSLKPREPDLVVVSLSRLFTCKTRFWVILKQRF